MKAKIKCNNSNFLTAIVFIIIGAALRLVPHAPNFAPIAAIALFGAVYFPKKIALILPIAIMAVSDLFIGFYDLKLMAAVYASFLLSISIGFWLKNNKKWYTFLVSPFLTASIFFFLTNFAVWFFGGWYPKTILGLKDCFVMALPFFKNTLLGEIFYVSVFFGLFELSKVLIANNLFSLILNIKHNIYEKRSVKTI